LSRSLSRPLHAFTAPWGISLVGPLVYHPGSHQNLKPGSFYGLGLLKFSPLKTGKTVSGHPAPLFFFRTATLASFRVPGLRNSVDELVSAGDFCSLLAFMALNRRQDSRPLGPRPSCSFDSPVNRKTDELQGFIPLATVGQTLADSTCHFNLAGHGGDSSAVWRS
jgi:hypothetical protein